MSGAGKLKRVLLSPPDYLEPAPINEIAKKWRETTLDKKRMAYEHQLLIQAYEDNGIEVEVLEAKPTRPNAVFARDFGACIREGYILGQFKYDLRLEEHIDYEKKMKALGIPKIASCQEGLFEGGDFMFLGGKYLVFGMADRTNEKGLKELKDQLAPLGYKVIGVPLNPAYLHLDMCFNLVDEKLAVAYRAGMPEVLKSIVEELAIDIIDLSEEEIFEHGCNLQALGDKKVISLAKNQRVNHLLEEKGMDVIALDIEEILKAGGGPHCMTFPLERL